MTKEEQKEYNRKWRESNKDKIKNYNKKRTIERKSESSSKEYRNNKTKEFRKNNYEKFLLYQIKASAKKRDLDFNLTIDDIVIPEFCPYLNLKLTKSVGGGLLDTAPSVDRIDTSKGYIKGNVRIISHLANKMKNNVSIDLLITFANNVLNIHNSVHKQQKSLVYWK